MDCMKCQDLMPDYQERRLAEEIRRDIERHLETCQECREQNKLLDRIDNLAKQLPRHIPGADVTLKIKKAIYKQLPAQRRTEFGPVLDMDELAEFLRVSKETIEEYFDEIPSFELGGKILFLRKSVEAWIEAKEGNFGFAMKWSKGNRFLNEYESSVMKWRPQWKTERMN